MRQERKDALNQVRILWLWSAAGSRALCWPRPKHTSCGLSQGRQPVRSGARVRCSERWGEAPRLKMSFIRSVHHAQRRGRQRLLHDSLLHDSLLHSFSRVCNARTDTLLSRAVPLCRVSSSLAPLPSIRAFRRYRARAPAAACPLLLEDSPDESAPDAA